MDPQEGDLLLYLGAPPQNAGVSRGYLHGDDLPLQPQPLTSCPGFTSYFLLLGQLL